MAKYVALPRIVKDRFFFFFFRSISVAVIMSSNVEPLRMSTVGTMPCNSETESPCKRTGQYSVLCAVVHGKLQVTSLVLSAYSQ